MKIDVSNAGDITIVTPVGPLVFGPGEQAMNDTISRLLTEGRFRLIIDMAGVAKMDSSGVDALVMACHHARERGGDAKLVGLVPRVHKLLELTQLTTVFEIYPDLAQAMSSFQ